MPHLLPFRSPLTVEGQQFVEDLISRMTLDEKLGQMTQPEKNSVQPGDVARFALGSVLSGGGGNPEPNTPERWRAMVSALIDESLTSRLGIPLLYGVDAVHGHNNVVGATIFPHNVGLGAAGEPELVRRIGRATALEVAATDVRWTFAPAVSIALDPRWGRSYEGYSHDPAAVSALAAALVEGLRGEGWNTPTAVLPSVKHFVADGATRWGSGKRARMGVEGDRTLANAHMDESFSLLLERGAWQIDQGDSEIDERSLREVHLPPYRAALAAGALNVMASYSSWQGLKMHAHRPLMTEVLKGELGFSGFVVSDWEGIDQIDPDYGVCVERSINAGVDMVMVPFDYRRFLTTLRRLVEDGQVPEARIDDAVRRILSAKYALGLFERPHTDPALLERIGCAEHRALAREAAAKSAVLLKNDGTVLPLGPHSGPVLVAGQADDLGLQCGGWTISWMGGPGATTAGTTVLEGLRGAIPLLHDPDASGDSRHRVGLVVLAEEAYAEGMGDRAVLTLTDEQRAVLGRVRERCERVAVVLLSGRPLVITDELAGWDAFVAAWLPGSEGDGVAEVLTGARPFTGRLPVAWPSVQPASGQGVPALFEVGAGL